jgi:hypothetical protein
MRGLMMTAGRRLLTRVHLEAGREGATCRAQRDGQKTKYKDQRTEPNEFAMCAAEHIPIVRVPELERRSKFVAKESAIDVGPEFLGDVAGGVLNQLVEPTLVGFHPDIGVGGVVGIANPRGGPGPNDLRKIECPVTRIYSCDQ